MSRLYGRPVDALQNPSDPDYITLDRFLELEAEWELDPWGEERIETAIAKGNYARFGGNYENWIYTDIYDTEAAEKREEKRERQLAHDAITAFRATKIISKG